ncbi:MAG TPA: hypothetical protein VGX23_03720 [Actinocrinis sp.]|nr:hypothetical protein [Actinocrinis sp.]
MPELSAVAQGALPSGHRWTVTAGGTPQDFYTMLATEHPDGHRDTGGMGGPTVYPGRPLNIYVGADNRGLHRVLARAHQDVTRARLVLESGESIDLAPIPIPNTDLVVFAALLPRTCEITSIDAIGTDGRLLH